MVILPALLLSAALLPASVLSLTGLTESQLETIVVDFVNFFRANGAMAPTAVRLAFHDCVGKCDGCLNLGNGANAGLSDLVYELEAMYPTYGTGTEYGLARADFWILASLSALHQTMTNGGVHSKSVRGPPTKFGNLIPLLQSFSTGREDCGAAASPEYDSDPGNVFPSPTMTGEEMLDYWGNGEMGWTFTPAEVTALMGAHTLGSAKIENSGYIGAWILAEAGDFNNRFYTYMLNNSVSWAPQNVAQPGEDPKFQIEAFEGSVKRAMMLNTDFELFYHLDLDSNAMPTCDMNVDSLTCQQRAETYATAVTYANDQDQWVEDFNAVFEKLIWNGY